MREVARALSTFWKQKGQRVKFVLRKQAEIDDGAKQLRESEEKSKETQQGVLTTESLILAQDERWRRA